MTTLIVHHADLDGFASAFILREYISTEFPETEIEFIAANYSDKKLESSIVKTCTGHRVYVVDFSFSQEIMAELASKSEMFVWIDHHKTAIDAFQGSEVWDGNNADTIILDSSMSATALTWKYCHPDTPMPRAFAHIDDQDMWAFQLEDTSSFISGLMVELLTYDHWKNVLNISKLSDAKYADILRTGETLMIISERARRSLFNNHVTKVGIIGRVSGRCYTGKAINNSDPTLTSKLGNSLAVASGTYGLLWQVSTDGVLCSLRSNDGYDVSAIAAEFGGGGHVKAAGFTVPLVEFIGWIKQ